MSGIKNFTPHKTSNSYRGYLKYVIPIFIMVIVPLFVTEAYIVHVLFLCTYFAFLSEAFNLVSYTGQLSLGHAAFLGLGAYASTYLFLFHGVSPLIGIFAGALLAAAAGFIISYPCFRFGLRGPFFALTTIAFAEVLSYVFVNLDAVGGAYGLLITFSKYGPSAKDLLFESKLAYYYIMLAMMLSLIYSIGRLEKSKFGFYVNAIREDEDAAWSLGINVTKIQVTAATLSAFLTGLGGTFYAFYFLYIEPLGLFAIDRSVEIAAPAIIGGQATVLGPIVGAFILTPIAEFLRAYFGGGLIGIHLIVYGAVIIAGAMLLPEGLIVGFERLLKRSSKSS
ncbi:MAG: branched-chain amino acid ABC transporter permease [Candidatus Bathyarchaeia archaeon]